MSWVVRGEEFKEASVRSSGTLSSIVLLTDVNDISWTGGEGKGEELDSITIISGERGGAFAALPVMLLWGVVRIPELG